MPTTAELRALGDCQFTEVVFISGIQYVFVAHSDLVGYDFGGGRVGRLGLQREGLSWRDSSDFRTSLFDNNRWNFTVTDFDGTLARLFGAVDDSERSLGDVPLGAGLPIHPNDSLAARTELHRKHVGTEFVGPGGERNLYPAPAAGTSAAKHTIAVPELDLAGAPVSDNPIVWAGRRVVIYRLWRDHVTYPDEGAGTASWRPFDEAKRLHWGVLRDNGTVRGREWTLECDGKDGWLRKPLFVGASPAPVRALGEVTLSTDDGNDKTGIAISLRTVENTADPLLYGGRDFGTFAITGTTTDAIRDEIIAAIETCKASAVDFYGAACPVWDSVAGYTAAMEVDGGVRIGVVDGAGEPGGELVVVVHGEVWALLGYDVPLQSSLYPDPDDSRAVLFEDGDYTTAPGPGYVVAKFRTWQGDLSEGGVHNDGLVREYRPQYLGGTSVVSPTQIANGGQILRLADASLGLDVTGSTVAHPGQLHRPVASDPADPDSPATIPGVGDCDRQGLWLLSGKRRFANSDEEFDECQVVEASWCNGSLSNDGLVRGDSLLVTKILIPRDFGFDRPPLQSEWITLQSSQDDAGQLTALPLANLGWVDGGWDWAHIIAQRLMYCTGTANGWDSYSADPAAHQDTGDNEPMGVHTVARDAELAELGLAIPRDMIHSPEAWKAEAAKIENDDILKVRLAITPGYQAMDALRSMLQPAGWAMHLRDGKYGVWCPADPVTQEDAQVVLTRTTKRGADRFDITPQELRKWQPVDKWTYDYDWDPKGKKTAKKWEQLAPDAGLRYRPGEVHETVMAHGMRVPNGVGERVSHLSKWWSRRHFEIKGWPVHAVDPGEDCWVGTIVRITDATLCDVLGEYGVTGRLGVITAQASTLGNECAVELDILVFADRSALPRLHAISAQGLGYDSTTRTITTAENWLRIESDGSWRDAPKFSEPNYTGIAQFGGAAELAAYQWNGDTWSLNLTGDVQSTTNTAIVLAAGTTSGTYYRDMDTICVLRPSNDQDAGEWPLQLYSPICDAAGEFAPPGGGTQDGYPWEP